jgi:hypothetical protein
MITMHTASQSQDSSNRASRELRTPSHLSHASKSCRDGFEGGSFARGHAQPWVLLASFLIALLAAFSAPAAKRVTVPEGGIKPDDLLIVDCLLPGQVRQLGGEFTYLSKRRPIRTSAKNCAIRGGEYVAFDRANMATALKVWMPQAEAGDANAMNYVGEIYEKGLGTTADFALAKTWYEKSAAKGSSSAMINLGSLYERGLGTNADMVQAMNWYRRASGLKESDLEVVTEADRATRHAQAEELERLRIETSALKTELTEARSALKAKQSELANNESLLKQTQAQVNKLRAESTEAALAKQQVATLQSLINEQKQRVNELQGKNDTVLAKLGIDKQQQGPAPRGTKPKLSVITPKLAMTRSGVMAAPLLTQLSSYQVIGRVYPSQGLRALKVNDQDIAKKVDENGIFEVNVSLSSSDTPVSIEAISQDGLSTVETFVLSQEAQANSAAKRVTSKLFQRRMRSDLGTFYALVIGNNSYQEFPALSTAVNDADAIGAILKNRYGYRTDVLKNATRVQVLQKLAALSESLKANDNLLIYYAGHGQIDGTGKGYWVPVDGKKADAGTWIGNDQITNYLGAMAAKHVMVIADSCYSGTLGGAAVRPIPLAAKDDDILFVSRVKARTVLSSGGLAPVLDSGANGHSIFAAALIRSLNTTDGLSEGYRVYEDLFQQVAQRSAVLRVSQRPQYSALKHAGHEGSEFFFLPKDA